MGLVVMRNDLLYLKVCAVHAYQILTVTGMLAHCSEKKSFQIKLFVIFSNQTIAKQRGNNF